MPAGYPEHQFDSIAPVFHTVMVLAVAWPGIVDGHAPSNTIAHAYPEPLNHPTENSTSNASSWHVPAGIDVPTFQLGVLGESSPAGLSKSHAEMSASVVPADAPGAKSVANPSITNVASMSAKE